MPLSFSDKYASSFFAPHELQGIAEQALTAADTLHAKTGLGNVFLGWLDLPATYDKQEFVRIKAAAKRIQDNSDVLIVIGIGGSYLGARAAIEFLRSDLYNALPKKTPEIYFSGNNISGSTLNNLLKLCEGKDVSVNVISKSGTTTEPAIAFRVFRELLVKKYGKEEAAKRIYCTTDKARGTLKQLADEEGYETFVIPDNIGGRFSVLTAVGLLPIAVCGADLDQLMLGAYDAMQAYTVQDINLNDCYRYAAVRNIFYRKGINMELLVSYEPRLAMIAEWWKQLYGESEGKDHKGLFPASVVFSTDLHSLGQYVQQGRRVMFETVIRVEDAGEDITIQKEENDGDVLNFLVGKSMSFVNEKAFLGTTLAHNEGGVPNLVVTLPKADEYNLGYLFYFFEKACAVSGYLLGVNPFDQPGVEEYKKNMFALLGKPGYEMQKELLENLL